MVTLVDKFMNFPHVLENFDSTPLIHCSGLYQPHILSAVFVGNAFFIRATPRELPEPMHEYIDRIVLDVPCNNECRWSSIENCVSSFPGIQIIFIVCFQGPDETCLLAYALDDFKMIKDERLVLLRKSGVNCIVTANA